MDSFAFSAAVFCSGLAVAAVIFRDRFDLRLVGCYVLGWLIGAAIEATIKCFKGKEKGP